LLRSFNFTLLPKASALVRFSACSVFQHAFWVLLGSPNEAPMLVMRVGWVRRMARQVVDGGPPWWVVHGGELVVPHHPGAHFFTRHHQAPLIHVPPLGP